MGRRLATGRRWLQGQEIPEVTLLLNHEILAAAYDYLRATPPFRDWNLPESEDVKFVVTRSTSTAGTHSIKDGKDVICVSSGCIGRTLSLVELMAHEMIHMHQRVVCMESRGVEHNAAFKKLVLRVSKIHGFDPMLF